MKLNTIAFIAVFLFSVPAFAQVNLGVKGGLNLYNLHGEDVDADMKAGIHLGALAHIHLSDQFAFQPELVYSMQGANEENGDAKINLDYLNVPLLLQYMFDNGFRLQAGPQIGFLLNAKLKSDGTSVDVKENFNTIDLSLPIGVGYVTPSGFGIDARYAIGLTDINDNGNSKTKNGGFQIGVFYLFNHN
jgi:hypothetical protein